jgi:lactoylglutathione lyase
MENSIDKCNVKQAVPFFMVTDMNSSLNFYIEKLGFDLKNTWQPNGHIEWCWIECGKSAIMLQEYRQKPKVEKLGEGICICFICEDALEIYSQILLKGLVISEPFVGNNMWVVSIQDPDGYNLLFESVTEIPEGTKYSERKI